MLHVAPGYRLELEVFGNVGGDEDVSQFAVCHEEFGDKVDVPVVDAAVLFPWLGALRVVAVLFEKLGATVSLSRLDFVFARE